MYTKTGDVCLAAIKSILFILLAAVLFVGCCGTDTKETADQSAEFPELSGPYLGQTLPGDEPEIFAPGIVCDGLNNRDMAITPEGDELFYTTHVTGFLYAAIMHTRLVDGVWTKPEVAAFSTDARFVYAEPHITPDGKRLMYLSNRPNEEGGKTDSDIWVVDRTEDGWGEPYNLGAPVCAEETDEYFPSVTNDGTIYFTRSLPRSVSQIFRSRLVDGVYQEPELLPAQVNCGTNRYNAFISPDESYLILGVNGMPDTVGATDYYVIFRDENDNWSEPVNLGNKVNTESWNEYSAYVTLDGKYLFFMAARLVDEDARPKTLSLDMLRDVHNKPMMGATDIFWVKADFIEALRPVTN